MSIAELWYENGDAQKGHQLFQQACGQGMKHQDRLNRWCDAVERWCDPEQVRDFYQQLARGNFQGGKRHRNLAAVMRRFYDYEKTHDGDTAFVQELAARLAE